MINQKNILIVCWDFPPNHGIGGRRWAKFAKNLLLLGHTVSVLGKAPKKENATISWIEEEYYNKIKRYTCKEHLLVTWLNDYKSALGFLKIRLAKFILNLFFKGTIYDKAIAVEDNFCELINRIIKEDKVNAVIVTGAPFNLMYYCAKIKELHPEIKLICDYRDPWLNAMNYGMAGLRASKKKDETDKQNFVMERADLITAPNKFLLEEIKHSYSGNALKAAFYELPHAYDPDDVIKTSGATKLNQKAKIVYGGTLYIGSEEFLELLNRNVSYLKENDTALNKLVEITFYTNETNRSELFKDNKDLVKFNKSIGDKIFQEIIHCDYILLLLSEHNKNYITSKFYEFLPYNKPFLYIGPRGFVADKIITEKLGYCIFNETGLHEIVSGKQLVESISSVNITQYSFASRTSDLLKTIWHS